MNNILKVAAGFAVLTGAQAMAAPVQWTVASGGNGHFYEFVSDGDTWSSALVRAGAASYNGRRGYLATVTSQGEMDFLRGLSGSLAWIGGTYADNAWRWASGPEQGLTFFGTANPDLAYSFWAGGEPNGNAGEPAVVANWAGNGAWNDWNPDNGVGYYVEYGGLSGAVPEPATWALMIGGFGLAGAAMRRRSRPVALA